MITVYYYINQKDKTLTLKSTNPNSNTRSPIVILERISAFVIEEDTKNGTFKLIKNIYSGNNMYDPFSSVAFKNYNEFSSNILNKNYLDVSIMFSFESTDLAEEFVKKFILKV